MTVIFDLDGTITRRDTFIPFLLCCLREFGPRRVSILLVPVYVALFAAGMISNDRLKELLLTVVLAGTMRDELDPVIEKFTAKLVRRGLNGAVVRTLSRHREKDDRIIIATASFDLYTQRVAEHLGVSTLVCTISEIEYGRVTGRIAGRNCHGAEKLRRVEKVCGPGTDWRETVFYTDHYSDLPLLRRVGRGILVNPGPRTRIHLRAYGFERFDARTAPARMAAPPAGGEPVNSKEG